MPTINKQRIRGKQVQYRHNNVSAQYYNTSAWRNLRNYYIKRHPLCEECMKNGKVKAAEEVHHIKEFLRGKTDEERYLLLTDESNLMSVCRKCHMKIHSRRK